MFDRLQQMEARYEELGSQLADPGDSQRSAEILKTAKQHRDLQEVVDKFRQYKQIKNGADDARGMLNESDPEIRAMATEELAQLEARLPAIEEDLKVMLLPKDPNDEKNVILEIRAGTGGDEASLFAAEIFRMYTRFAEQHRWKVEVLSLQNQASAVIRKSSPSSKVTACSRKMKYESGVHRVQRVPETETQGRVHTSADYGRGAAGSRRSRRQN